MSGDQFTQLIRHAVAQPEATPFRYGHIASYDPDKHRVRCIIPSMTDQDGNPLLSPWMPMGTPFATKGAGVQVIYEGGATIDNPTAGEQVMIAIFDRQRGVAAVPCLFYHASHPPPSTNLPQISDGYSANATPSVAGDVIISAPSQQPGGANSFIRIRKAGQIEIWSAGPMTAEVNGSLTARVNTGDVAVTVVQGNATLEATNGTVNVLGAAIRLAKNLSDAVLALCNINLLTAYNAHVHGNSGPPNPQAPPQSLTTIVRAE